MTRSILLIAAAFIGHTAALWPQPQSLTTGSESKALKLSSSFDITLNGVTNAPQDLLDAISRTKSFIANDKLERLVVGRDSVDSDAISAASELSELVVSLSNSGDVKSISEEAVLPIEDRAEGYELSVPEDGSAATLKANSTLGLFRGLTTFEQLWYFADGTTYAVGVPMQVNDNPKYPYRGLMLDTARNYFPVADIKRTLDAMSLVKLNTFHWHIVDSQSFPLQVPGFEELSTKGAYSSDAVYTTSDVEDVVSYAAARGIDVIAELDTPGHTSIIAHAHPEHIACFEKTPWATYANEPPAGQLRLASPATINFTNSLIDAVSGLFGSKYFSTGGDEVNAKCYAEDEQTQADLAKTANGTLEGAIGQFVLGTHEVLHEKGKTAVVWQEMALDHAVEMRNDTVVFVWISSTDAQSVAAKGYRLIHAASDYFYLDCGHGGWVGANPLGNSWCDPFKTWQKAYSFDPLANLTSSQASLVLGGQSLLWTEQSGPNNLDATVWPRAGAAAEVFWSGGGGNVSEALPRLHEVAFRLDKRGVGAVPLQPLWCALRPGVCDLTA
ncbi:Glucosamine-6-phosphate isomerase (Glucosamine-6-phosphate deaminase) (GNPDA) (GlcN6P deaminase) [Marasmius crinis-equi]|uniref:Beta-hexosaminidase n=2 Tax=Marasmius crinis-equi TaxID=585013 RepID=A0ABR3FCC1_9AGAR